MNKADALVLAEALGLVVSPAWRAPELKEMIKESLFPTSADDDRTALQGLGSKTWTKLQSWRSSSARTGHRA